MEAFIEFQYGNSGHSLWSSFAFEDF